MILLGSSIQTDYSYFKNIVQSFLALLKYLLHVSAIHVYPRLHDFVTIKSTNPGGFQCVIPPTLQFGLRSKLDNRRISRICDQQMTDFGTDARGFHKSADPLVWFHELCFGRVSPAERIIDARHYPPHVVGAVVKE